MIMETFNETVEFELLSTLQQRIRSHSLFVEYSFRTGSHFTVNEKTPSRQQQLGSTCFDFSSTFFHSTTFA